MKKFSKKAIGIQIFCGILFAIVANPYLIFNHFFHSKLMVIVQIIIVSLFSLNIILKSSKEDFNKAYNLNYFRHNKNYFAIFLFSVVEVLFLSYVYMKYLMKKDIDVYIYILLPAGIAFIMIQIVSYLIRKERYPVHFKE